MISEVISKKEVDVLFLSLSKIEDPRVQNRCDHKLLDILVITICGILCGSENWQEIECFAKERKSWFEKYLELRNGIPSHDTLERVFSLINVKLLEKAFLEWVKKIKKVDSLLVSVDGKVVGATHEGLNTGTTALNLVSVLCHESGLVLNQSRASAGGYAETGAGIECLNEFELEGTTVTGDAGFSNKNFISMLVTKKADYILPIKGNNKRSLREIEKQFNTHKSIEIKKKQTGVHGRQETRYCSVLAVKQMSQLFEQKWPEVKTLIKIKRIRSQKDQRYNLQERDKEGKITYRVNPNRNKLKSSEEIVYYVSSRVLDSKEAMNLIRTHWGIENKVHWILDVAFNEDSWRVREKTTAHNLSTVRKICFNMLQKAPGKGSKKTKMKKASWNPNYMEEVLFSSAF